MPVIIFDLPHLQDENIKVKYVSCRIRNRVRIRNQIKSRIRIRIRKKIIPDHTPEKKNHVSWFGPWTDETC